MFGGFNRCALNDLYVLDSKTAKWAAITVPKGKRPA